MARRRFAGKTVVVTGGTAGVGRATARAFAEQGAAVAVLARSEEGLDETRRELQQLGARVLALPVDVADADAVEQAATTIEAQLGEVDIWVNNAMLSVFSPVTKMRADEYRRVTEVTYLGYVYGSLAALRRMKQRDSGVILQVGSALAHQAIPLQSAYCAAKFAVRGFTDSLRIELAHEDSSIRAIMVQLPAHNTPQFRWVRSRLPHKAQPVPPIYQPEVAARAILWAAEHETRELYVGWPAIRAIAGQRLVPWFVEWSLARNGFESQQTDEPYEERPDNVFSPVDGMHDAHGVFDDIARSRSIALEVSMHRRTIAAAGALAVAGAIAAVGRR